MQKNYKGERSQSFLYVAASNVTAVLSKEATNFLEVSFNISLSRAEDIPTAFMKQYFLNFSVFVCSSRENLYSNVATSSASTSLEA